MRLILLVLEHADMLLYVEIFYIHLVADCLHPLNCFVQTECVLLTIGGKPQLDPSTAAQKPIPAAVV